MPTRMHRRTMVLAVATMATLLPSKRLGAQAVSTGLEVGGVPAINFDSDEGFGYGVIAELYQYGYAGRLPYVWTVQPTIFLTTEGRRDYTVFFDAPHLLPREWRLDAFIGSERQIATPYYGVGNEVAYDEALDRSDGPNPFYYRFGRTRRSVLVNVQHGLGDTPLRGLLGIGVVRHELVSVPEADGTSLFAEQEGARDDPNWANFARAGLIWDTRDRETAPTNGVWSEVLVQVVPRALGAERSYTRLTVTDRRYFPIGRRLVFAHRYLVQTVGNGAPIHELFAVQTSFKQQEGLGGAKTVRGLLKNRFVGRGMVVWNAELRWRAAEFALFGRPFHAVLSAFLDQGRVWEEGVQVGELLTDLHRGVGGGVRIGMGDNFTVALDVATSEETGLPMYIGLGYLY